MLPEQRLAACANRDDAMRLLIPLMSPAHHHSAAGLMATRIYRKLLDQEPCSYTHERGSPALAEVPCA